MTPIELRALLASLGWSLPEAARRIGLPYTSLYAAAHDGPHHRALHPSAAMLLRLLAAVPAARDWLDAA